MSGPPYAIIDEPRPGTLERFATAPMWPFLALLLAGGWLGWSWFAFNAFAVGSPTRWRETLLAVAAAGGSGLLLATLVALPSAESLVRDHRPYILLGLFVWKLGFGYGVFLLQLRTFGLFEYFGGRPRNGIFVLLLGMFALRARVMDAVIGTGSLFLLGVAQ